MPSSDPLVTSNKAKQEEHMQVGWAGPVGWAGQCPEHAVRVQSRAGLRIGHALPPRLPHFSRHCPYPSQHAYSHVADCPAWPPDTCRDAPLLPPHPCPPAPRQAVREAFLAQDALAAVVGMLAEPLSRHPRMSEQDAALTQLVITFLKCGPPRRAALGRCVLLPAMPCCAVPALVPAADVLAHSQPQPGPSR